MPTPRPGIVARALVDRVIDGDTLVLHVQWPITVRLQDCWAPEMRGEDAVDGAASRRQLLDLVPVGSSVLVEIQSEHAGNLGDLMSFGRVVGHVWAEGEESHVSEQMVAAGYATSEKERS